MHRYAMDSRGTGRPNNICLSQRNSTVMLQLCDEEKYLGLLANNHSSYLACSLISIDEIIIAALF